MAEKGLVICSEIASPAVISCNLDLWCDFLAGWRLGAVAGAAGGALQAIFNAENHGKSNPQLRYIHNYG